MRPFPDILRSDAFKGHPTRPHVGDGILDRASSFLPEGPILLVTTPGFTRRGLTQRMRAQFGDRLVVEDSIAPNPQLDALDETALRHRPSRIAGILAVGGGSVIDSAKVLAVAIPCPLDRPLHAHFREKQPVEWPAPLPWVATPTTAGTGSEATPFATVWDSVTQKKFSLESPSLYPPVALLDPRLTLNLPPKETRHTALDTLSHSLESLWSKRRTQNSQLFSTEALERAVAALPVLLARPDDIDARATMQEASFLAGVAISHTRTAIAHAISYPLTLRFGMPHGLACGFTLPAILDACDQARVDLGIPDALAQSVRRLLDALDLAAETLSYAPAAEIEALLPEMSSPGRSDNFLLPADARLIQDLLRRALPRAI
jgi:alcohol dehydrogenase